MYVVATAGHVDHGKSTLVRLLTGMEPDRLAEERRRGMTIDLGFAWTELPTGETVAFVDVPGHERFVGTMLAGVGPVPAVLLVVAADQGWQAQSSEHLDALDALGVRHGLLAVTRCDLADPAPVEAEALERCRATSLGAVPAVRVSGRTGEGVDDLRLALALLVDGLPPPDAAADVRLWVDRAFTIRGAGTVVTGTLPVGSVRVGDELVLARDGRRVTVRGVQALGRPVPAAAAVARVALNLRGVALDEVSRGDVLVTPDRWLTTDLVDVRLRRAEDLPAQLTVHVGSAAVPAAVRPLGERAARLRLDRALPLRIGDVCLLRDPGVRRIVAGVTVLDVRPPSLRRRGAAVARAAVLAEMDGTPNGADEVRRRGVVSATQLRAMGATPPSAPLAGDWLVDPALAADLTARIAAVVPAYAAAHPLEPAVPLEAVRRELRLPDVRLVSALVPAPYRVQHGRVVGPDTGPGLPPAVLDAVERVRADLGSRPFAAPDSDRLRVLGLGARELGAAVRAGLLVRVADGVYLAPGAPERALDVLRALPQPFTLSAARQVLDTSRRVAVPLLELLARQGRTRRRPDDTHEVLGA